MSWLCCVRREEAEHPLNPGDENTVCEARGETSGLNEQSHPKLGASETTLLGETESLSASSSTRLMDGASSPPDSPAAAGSVSRLADGIRDTSITDEPRGRRGSVENVFPDFTRPSKPAVDAAVDGLPAKMRKAPRKLGSLKKQGSVDFETVCIPQSRRGRRKSVENEISAMFSSSSEHTIADTDTATTGNETAKRGRRASVEMELNALQGTTKVLLLSSSESESESESEDEIPTTPITTTARRPENTRLASTKPSRPKARRGSIPEVAYGVDQLRQVNCGVADARDVVIDVKTSPPRSRLLPNLRIENLTTLTLLGVGTFSRVKMVQDRSTGSVYALKIMAKSTVDRHKQKLHVINEKEIMTQMGQHPFLCTLWGTWQDPTFLYMLLEICQGGEVFSRLVAMNVLDEATTQFYVGCVILALEALHACDNIYRDLKPENVLIDAQGFAKISDFGFAKHVPHCTYTRCGTPEYVPPEMLTNSGHGKPADHWSLGVFMFECLQSVTPFSARDYAGTYKKILQYEQSCTLRWIRRFPVSRAAREMVEALLCPDPRTRLGSGSAGTAAMKTHAWYEDFDWGALERRELRPPWVPKLASATDTSYFDTEDYKETEEYLPYTGDDSWCIGF